MTAAEALARSRRLISDLCSGKERWTMRIPANRQLDHDLILSDCLDAIEAELAVKDEEIARLKNEIDGHESFQRSVNEALNRGDGSYRP